MLGEQTENKQEDFDAATWSKEYYNLTSGLKRYQLLEMAMKEGLEPEENKMRLKLWEARYGKYTGEEPEVDKFLILWLDLSFAYSKRNSLFAGKSLKKAVVQDLKTIGFEELLAQGEKGEKVLYDEMKHMSRFYFNLCMTDKTYRSKLLGIISLKDNELLDKITEEVYIITVQTPSALGLEKELSVFSKAARDAFALDFPKQNQKLEEYMEKGLPK